MTAEDPIDRTDEDVLVRQWMHAFAAVPLPQSRLPEPQLLWWKAELLRRWDEERKALAPIERAEPITVTIGVIGALVLMLTLWQSAPGPTATLIFATVVGLAALIAVGTMMVRQLRQ